MGDILKKHSKLKIVEAENALLKSKTRFICCLQKCI
jgi:hypothetical protein